MIHYENGKLIINVDEITEATREKASNLLFDLATSIKGGTKAKEHKPKPVSPNPFVKAPVHEDAPYEDAPIHEAHPENDDPHKKEADQSPHVDFLRSVGSFDDLMDSLKENGINLDLIEFVDVTEDEHLDYEDETGVAKPAPFGIKISGHTLSVIFFPTDMKPIPYLAAVTEVLENVKDHVDHKTFGLIKDVTFDFTSDSVKDYPFHKSYICSYASYIVSQFKLG